ncbi:MAG: hypothetical protein PF480_08300, partial [Roseovarius sp.]|nr:hypothetical protein [Roseovarius sp.]
TDRRKDKSYKREDSDGQGTRKGRGNGATAPVVQAFVVALVIVMIHFRLGSRCEIVRVMSSNISCPDFCSALVTGFGQLDWDHAPQSVSKNA